MVTLTHTRETAVVGLNDGTCVWRAALLDDPISWVIVVDGDAVICEANRAFELAFTEFAPMIGRRFTDHMRAEYAAERLAVVHRVLATGRSITMYGVIRGRWMRQMIRPIPREAGQSPRALIVIQPAAIGPEDEHGGEAEIIVARHHDMGKLEVLSQRELVILALIGEGYTSPEIGRRLHRSGKTIEWHRNSIAEKLGTGSRIVLAQLARQAGLVYLLKLQQEHPEQGSNSPIFNTGLDG